MNENPHSTEESICSTSNSSEPPFCRHSPSHSLPEPCLPDPPGISHGADDGENTPSFPGLIRHSPDTPPAATGDVSTDAVSPPLGTKNVNSCPVVLYTGTSLSFVILCITESLLLTLIPSCAETNRERCMVSTSKDATEYRRRHLQTFLSVPVTASFFSAPDSCRESFPNILYL